MLKNKIILALATFFGVGFIPLLPGTASCLVGLLFVWFIKSQITFFLVTIFFLFLAFCLSGKAEKILGQKDAKQIVIDDFSGGLITFLFVPKTLVFVVAGFFVFRMLDMIKIPPADRLEKKAGSLGIVGDDLAAGIYANLILQSLRLLLKISS